MRSCLHLEWRESRAKQNFGEREVICNEQCVAESLTGGQKSFWKSTMMSAGTKLEASLVVSCSGDLSCVAMVEEV